MAAVPGRVQSTATLLSPGLVLDSNGQWSRLVDDGNGGLTAATGVQGQGPWSAFCEASSAITNSQTCVFGGLPDLYLRIETLGNDRAQVAVWWLRLRSSPRRVACSSSITGPVLRHPGDRNVRLLVGSALRRTRAELCLLGNQELVELSDRIADRGTAV